MILSRDLQRASVSLEIGIGLRGSAGIAQRAARLEALGFDCVHCGEHIFFRGPTPSALIGLGVAAGATTRLKLLSAVLLLPLYPAALVAKMASALDVASCGRFRLGVGLGGEYEPEFHATGVPLAERGARADEALRLIRQLFTGKPVTFAGRWARLDGLKLDPPPYSPGGPEIWVGGRRRAAQRRAGRFADVWMPYMCTPEQLADGMRVVRAAAQDAGRDPKNVRGAVCLWATTGRDDVAARLTARSAVEANYKQDFSRLQRYLVAGTPEQCATRLREYAAAGADAIELLPACNQQEEEGMIELIAEEILPALRAG